MQYFNPDLLRKEAAESSARKGLYLPEGYSAPDVFKDLQTWLSGGKDGADAARNRTLSYFVPRLIGAVGLAAVAKMLGGRRAGVLLPLLAGLGGYFLGGQALPWMQKVQQDFKTKGVSSSADLPVHEDRPVTPVAEPQVISEEVQPLPPQVSVEYTEQQPGIPGVHQGARPDPHGIDLNAADRSQPSNLDPENRYIALSDRSIRIENGVPFVQDAGLVAGFDMNTEEGQQRARQYFLNERNRELDSAAYPAETVEAYRMENNTFPLRSDASIRQELFERDQERYNSAKFQYRQKQPTATAVPDPSPGPQQPGQNKGITFHEYLKAQKERYRAFEKPETPSDVKFRNRPIDVLSKNPAFTANNWNARIIFK